MWGNPIQAVGARDFQTTVPAALHIDQTGIGVAPFVLTPIQEFVARCYLQASFSAWQELAAPALVDPDLESPVRWSPYAHQRRVCACGLYSSDFLGLDFRKNKFAARGSHISLLDRRRRDFPVRD
jgi:hypothetical protein